MPDSWSRRDLVAILGLAALVQPASAAPRQAGEPGRVGVARIPGFAGTGAVTEVTARAALDQAVVAATGAATARAATSALFAPEDVVGIKLSCLAGPRLSPRPELVAALAALLTDAGVHPKNIVVFERTSRELERAGHAVRSSGGRFVCVGIDNDYERQPATSGSIGSCFARLVTSRCTALISLGVVKDHDLAGVSAGLKNWYGVIHNPNKYHDTCCDPYVADVVAYPAVRDKLRLTVLDGALAQCHGGPAFRADATWPLGVVVAATDPVAADVWAWRVIDAERVRRGLPTLAAAGRPPRFLATAARYGLGVADPVKVVEAPA